MALRLYMDHNVRRAITDGLRARGIDVLTALEDGTHRWPDPQLLDRATALDRVLFTRDDDLVVEARRRQRQDEPFAGVLYAHQVRLSIRETLDELELIANVCEPEELTRQLWFLPLP